MPRAFPEAWIEDPASVRAGTATAAPLYGNPLVLAWLLHRRDPERVALIGPRTPHHLDGALAALGVSLDADASDALHAVDAVSA